MTTIATFPQQLTGGTVVSAPPVMENFDWVAPEMAQAFYVTRNELLGTGQLYPAGGLNDVVAFNTPSPDPYNEWPTNSFVGEFMPNAAGLYQFYAQIVVSIQTGGGFLTLALNQQQQVVYVPALYTGQNITLTICNVLPLYAGQSISADLENGTPGDVTVLPTAGYSHAIVTRIGG